MKSELPPGIEGRCWLECPYPAGCPGQCKLPGPRDNSTHGANVHAIAKMTPEDALRASQSDTMWQRPRRIYLGEGENACAYAQGYYTAGGTPP